ncbi:PspC domain-containing protein [Streptomyces sp. Ac-502]|uniref:PspC domain-containing protein n=1 Tax=Streptomyces sp. Ac-502 TaxID=3342801 RepID=UPI003862D0AC
MRGLGRHWGLDPVIFRIVLAVLAASGGIGLIAYGFAWLLIPQDGEDENEGRKLLSGRVEGTALTALLFALVGCGYFLTSLANRGVLTFTVMLALAVGGSAYWSRQRRAEGADSPGTTDPAAAPTVVDAPPETTAPPTRNTPSWWRDPSPRKGRPAWATSGDRATLRTDTSRRTPHPGRPGRRAGPPARPRGPDAAPHRPPHRPGAAGRAARSAAGRSCWRSSRAWRRAGPSRTPTR